MHLPASNTINKGVSKGGCALTPTNGTYVLLMDNNMLPRLNCDVVASCTAAVTCCQPFFWSSHNNSSQQLIWPQPRPQRQPDLCAYLYSPTFTDHNHVKLIVGANKAGYETWIGKNRGKLIAIYYLKKRSKQKRTSVLIL